MASSSSSTEAAVTSVDNDWSIEPIIKKSLEEFLEFHEVFRVCQPLKSAKERAVEDLKAEDPKVKKLSGNDYSYELYREYLGCIDRSIFKPNFNEILGCIYHRANNLSDVCPVHYKMSTASPEHWDYESELFETFGMGPFTQKYRQEGSLCRPCFGRCLRLTDQFAGTEEARTPGNLQLGLQLRINMCSGF